MNKKLIQMSLLFIFFVIIFHIVNYYYSRNKENMVSSPTEKTINDYIDALTKIIDKASPKRLSSLFTPLKI